MWFIADPIVHICLAKAFKYLLLSVLYDLWAWGQQCSGRYRDMYRMRTLEWIAPWCQETDVIQRAVREDALRSFSGEIQLLNSRCLCAQRGSKTEKIHQLWCHRLCHFIKITLSKINSWNWNHHLNKLKRSVVTLQDGSVDLCPVTTQ